MRQAQEDRVGGSGVTVAQSSGVSTGTNGMSARAAACLARAARRKAAALWSRDGEPPQGVSS